jgi:peptidyl-Asp metalloendopeptidase
MNARSRTASIPHRTTVPATALGLLLIGSTPAPAQSTNDVTNEAGPERVIISHLPQQRGRLHSLRHRILGKIKSQRLTHTNSEVWTVPKTRMARLRYRLRLLGVKVTYLRAGWHHVLKRDRRPIRMSRSQEDVLAKVRRSPETVNVGLMRASEPAVAEYALTRAQEAPVAAGSNTLDDGMSRIVIPLNDNQQVAVLRTKARQTEKGVTWRGTIEETGESAVLMWWKDGRLTGVLGYKGHIYTVMNIDGEVHAVIEVDPKKMPPDHANRPADSSQADQARGSDPSGEPSTLPKVEPISAAELEALSAKKIVIDVMMLYTARAASRYMLQPGDAIELAIEQANESFRNSALGHISLRLVHTQAVDYDEKDAEHFVHLYRMVDGEGPFKDLRQLRNEKRADLVGLIVDDATGCGLSTRVASDSEEAYFIVHHSCAAITISIAHEVGHLLGARHDRRADPNNTPFAYGHGYVTSKWRDIMSYKEACNGCPRLPFWSNPRVLYKGEPTGTQTEDNARVILEQAERVSNFR